MSEREHNDSKVDLVFVHGRTEGSDRLQVIRLSEAAGIQLGELGPVREGEAIRGELVKLTARPEDDRLFDAETVPLLPERDPAEAPAGAPTGAVEVRRSHGPAQVSTPAYQANWESIFGKKPLPN